MNKTDLVACGCVLQENVIMLKLSLIVFLTFLFSKRFLSNFGVQSIEMASLIKP